MSHFAVKKCHQLLLSKSKLSPSLLQKNINNVPSLLRAIDLKFRRRVRKIHGLELTLNVFTACGHGHLAHGLKKKGGVKIFCSSNYVGVVPFFKNRVLSN